MDLSQGRLWNDSVIQVDLIAVWTKMNSTFNGKARLYLSPTPLYLAAKPVTSYTPPLPSSPSSSPHTVVTAFYFPWQYLLFPPPPPVRYCRQTWAIRVCLASAHLICTNTLTTQLPFPLKIDSPASVPTIAYWEHFLITGSVTNHVVFPNFLSKIRNFSYLI